MDQFGTARYQPTVDSYFPHLRRGHGTTHPEARMYDGIRLRRSCPCVCPACERVRDNGRGEGHIDKATNVAEWKTEHGIAPVKRQQRGARA